MLGSSAAESSGFDWSSASRFHSGSGGSGRPDTTSEPGGAMQARSVHRYHWLKRYKCRPLQSAQLDARARSQMLSADRSFGSIFKRAGHSKRTSTAGCTPSGQNTDDHCETRAELAPDGIDLVAEPLAEPGQSTGRQKFATLPTTRQGHCGNGHRSRPNIHETAVAGLSSFRHRTFRRSPVRRSRTARRLHHRNRKLVHRGNAPSP